MSTELCPSCGEKPRYIHYINAVSGGHVVHCDNFSGCVMQPRCAADTEAEAWAAWNRRYVCLDKNRWIPVGEGLPGKKELDIKIQVANFKTKRVLQWTWFNSIAQISGLKTCYTHWRPIILPEGE